MNRESIAQTDLVLPLSHITFLAHYLSRILQNGALGPSANTEGPDQPKHPRSLIRAFAVRRESLVLYIECFNGEQMPGLDFTHGKDDVNPQILRMFEGTFSLYEANFIVVKTVLS